MRLTFTYFYNHPNINKGHKEIKDLWSKLCSAMDWIDVAGIGLYNLDDKLKLLNKDRGLNNALLLYEIISVISLLNQSIDNIWKGFEVGNNFFNYKLFYKDNHVFHGKALKNRFSQKDLVDHHAYKQVDDNIYFSCIRAFFGTHASNGNRKIFIDSNGVSHKIRLFSSYSTKDLSDKEIIYSVNMYCNNHFVDKHINNLKINVRDLIKFAYSRYHSLVKLSKVIDAFYRKVRKNIRNKSLYLNKNDTLLSQLKYLRKFAKKTRFMDSYYEPNIICYINFLGIVGKNNESNRFSNKDWYKIKNYVDKIIKGHVIKTYYHALDNAAFYRSKYIESIYKITPKWSYNNKINYDYTKVMSVGGSLLEGSSYLSPVYSISLLMLIKSGYLPKYAKGLNPAEICILIISRTFYDNPKMLDEKPINKNSSNNFESIITELKKYVKRDKRDTYKLK